MPKTDSILVQYVRNSEETSATGALKFHDDERSDLEIGQLGYVTETELHLAAANGVILSPVTKKDAEKEGLTIPEKVDLEPTPTAPEIAAGVSPSGGSGTSTGPSAGSAS